MSETLPAADGLKRNVGLFGVVSLGLGTAVGVSIFSILAPAAAVAGPAMLVSMLIAIIPMIVFALIYSFMGAAAPATGASFEWPRRFVHPFAGFLISWMRIAGSTAALIVLTMVLVSYMAPVISLPSKLVMFGIFAAVFLINLAGVSLVARSQAIMLVILLATCAVFVFGGAGHVAPENFVPFADKGVIGILAAIPLLISLFLGIESATEVGGEVRNPRRNIPLGIAISVALTAAVYLSVAVIALGVLGADKLAASSAPLLDAARVSLGSNGQLLILVCAFVAIGSSINATFVIMTRFLYAMSRAGMLPAFLGRANEKSGVPQNAVYLAFGLCCLGLFMPQNLVFLFLAVNIPTIHKYAATCLSAIGLCRREPELREAASFSLPAGMVYALAGLGIFLGAAIILLGISADWRPYMLLGGWALLGIVYYLVNLRVGSAQAGD
jgi:APA family basic amino acid/polyamine antiporter